MAIASNEPGPSAPSIILGVVRAPTEDVPNIEKTIRKHDIMILQKKVLEVNLDEMKSWFGEAPSEDNDMETLGYVLQADEAPVAWTNVTQVVGPSICGQAPQLHLKELFPSVVTDEYLIQHERTKEFLKPLMPQLISVLKEICQLKPDDPVGFLADHLLTN